MAHRTASRCGGFTLFEVLVALAIVAVALAASLRAAAGSTDAAQTLRLRTLAAWVAENHVAERRAREDWPPLGRSSGSTTQGGIAFLWREAVSATPSADFRRIDVAVSAGGDERTLARVSGVLSLAPSR